jgi:hypothetical protein
MSDDQRRIAGKMMSLHLRHPVPDLLLAWLAATLFSGLPSTIHALLTDNDPLEATRAAGSMLVSPDSGNALVLAAAAVVHPTVSAFWTGVFGVLLPRRHVALLATVAAAAVAVIDLRLIAPAFFPAVAALPFWPQFADHLAWGALLGVTLRVRQKR